MVSWSSGGAQRTCGDHIHLIQLELKGKPIFEKSANFPFLHVEMGWIPMWRTAPLVIKWALICKKPAGHSSITSACSGPSRITNKTFHNR